ncbi:DUF881 domain-containing protein [uncultured Tessaracoccus sp.]|uniref:DUF881 domain-containing protein n=1 Tax=uncultured Tessaracoccus sp. TaxID=905023 RepID=UPI0025CCA4CD|nr:DUF881 domain-containing protein [uncultured Tessaracoccus sp.]
MTRRPDESMNLLRTLTEGALEPEYRTTRAPRRTPWVTVLTVGMIATLLTYALMQTFTNRDVHAAERDALLAEVSDGRAHQEQLTADVAALEREIRDLQLRVVADPRKKSALEAAELSSGAIDVRGPGVVVTVDDAPDATASEGRILDSDLALLVNGLFEAGAEAVAVNGRRITTRTPIRSAGAAITVDYVSLSPPYRVEAIGDEKQLPGRFGATRAAGWWQYLQLNYGLRMDIAQSDEPLSLPADPGLTLRLAEGG